MRKPWWSKTVGILLSFLLASAGCGYRVGGQGTSLPTDLEVVAVPAFENQTSVRGLEQRLTSAVMEEFIHRTRYRVVGRPEAADAVLRGTVTNVSTVPVIFDPATGRASVVVITVRLAIEFRDRRSKEVLFANPDYLFREQYEITSDLESFFEEQDPALDRLARDFAASLVSAILENF